MTRITKSYSTFSYQIQVEIICFRSKRSQKTAHPMYKLLSETFILFNYLFFGYSDPFIYSKPFKGIILLFFCPLTEIKKRKMQTKWKMRIQL